MKQIDFLETASPIEQRLCEHATYNNIPINGILELLPLCNMNCKMCYVRLSPSEMEKQGGRLRTVEEWLSLAAQMQKAGTLFILLTGGEPLLYPDFKFLYLELKKMGMILTINTNGTLIDEEWADFFAKNPPRRINITLYGKDGDTYEKLCGYRDGYEKTCNGIRLLKERGIAVKINGSITEDNFSDGEAIIEFAESVGAAYKMDTYMYPGERERNRPFSMQARLLPEKAALNRVLLLKKEHKEDFDKLVEELLQRVYNTAPGVEEPSCISCRAGRSSFMINWQGVMRSCVMVTEPTVPIIDGDFMAAWKKLVEETAKIRVSAKCNACQLKNVCQVCAASALLETGDYAGTPEYMCSYTKEFVRLLELENQKKKISEEGNN